MAAGPAHGGLTVLIDFVHSGDAYLPELQAYAEFVRRAGHASRLHRDARAVPADASVVWWMCGRVPAGDARRLASAVHVHEYASASVPPLAWAKDRYKRWVQPRPHYRLFQNDWVRERMAFDDGVPGELRDMGLAPEFLAAAGPRGTADHDFVYLGEMRRLRHFLPVFAALGRTGHSVLLVGDVPADLKQALARLARVTVTGRVPHTEVPSCLRRARVGLNLVPVRAPFDQQTSTKLLEYCATGLRILSTDYAWVRGFEARHAARFAYLPRSSRLADIERSLEASLAGEAGPPPDLRALAWPRLLAPLAIWRVLGIVR